MKVSHNEKELVFSKTFMISELGTTRIEIPDDSDGPWLLLELVFSETDDGEQKLSGQTVDTHTLRLDFQTGTTPSVLLSLNWWRSGPIRRRTLVACHEFASSFTSWVLGRLDPRVRSVRSTFPYISEKRSRMATLNVKTNITAPDESRSLCTS